MLEGLSDQGFAVLRRLLPGVAAGALADRARELEAGGEPVEDLHDGDPVFAPTSRYPDLVDLVEQVVGSDLDCVAARFGEPGPDRPEGDRVRVWIAVTDTELALTGPSIDGEAAITAEAGDVVVTTAGAGGRAAADGRVAEYDYGPAGTGVPIRRAGEPAYDRPAQEAP